MVSIKIDHFWIFLLFFLVFALQRSFFSSNFNNYLAYFFSYFYLSLFWCFSIFLHWLCVFFLFQSGQKRRRQTQQSKKMQTKPIRSKVETIMQNPSTTFKYIPTRLGAGKISIDDRIYDYHFKSQGTHFWKCCKSDCPAKAITRLTEAWILNDKHEH